MVTRETYVRHERPIDLLRVYELGTVCFAAVLMQVLEGARGVLRARTLPC